MNPLSAPLVLLLMRNAHLDVPVNNRSNVSTDLGYAPPILAEPRLRRSYPRSSLLSIRVFSRKARVLKKILYGARGNAIF